MRILILPIITILVSSLAASPARAFELQDGDRVVLVGGGLIERAQRYGAIEARITAAFPDRHIVFRNIGWSGDTVFGHSRSPGRTGSVFGTPEQGFRNLIQQVRDTDPDVLIVGYGFNESFDRQKGFNSFADGASRLFDELTAITSRIVVLSPPPQFTPPSGNINMAARNEMIDKYGSVLRSQAGTRGLSYVDLLSKLDDRAHGATYGVHLSAAGYEVAAKELGSVFNIPTEADIEDGGELRRMIVAKNRLFLHSWRPRNTAFISGERMDEQEPSHFDVPKFVPFVERADQEIHKFKQKLDNE